MKQKILILILVLALIASCVFALSVWGLVRKTLSAGPTVPDAQTEPPPITTEWGLVRKTLSAGPTVPDTQTEPPPTTTEAVPTLCIHDWQAVTCGMPNVCTLCGESDGSQLAHSWTEATCSNAKTCTRCGLQVGAALKCNWQRGSTWEPSVCTRCGDSCDHYSRWQGGSCMEPASCAGCGATQSTPLLPRDNAENHVLTAWEVSGNTIFRTCTLCGLRDEPGTLTTKDHDNVMNLLAREWTSGSYSLTFSRDGTFTGKLDDAVSGTWELMMACSPYEFSSRPTACLNLYYTRDEAPQASSIRVYYSLENNAWEDAQFGTYLYLAEYRVNFKCAEEKPQRDDPPLATPEEAAQMILGSWTSINRTGNSIYMAEAWQKMSLDYTVEFFADGTFSAHLDKDISGTWKIDRILTYLVDYTCTVNEEGEYFYAYIEQGILNIQYSCDLEASPFSYDFQRMDPQTIREKKSMMEEAMPLPVGSWVSHSYVTVARDLVYSEACASYQITIRKDGTLTYVYTDPETKERHTLERNWYLAEIRQEETCNLYRINTENCSIYFQYFLRNNVLYIRIGNDDAETNINYELVVLQRA